MRVCVAVGWEAKEIDSNSLINDRLLLLCGGGAEWKFLFLKREVGKSTTT